VALFHKPSFCDGDRIEVAGAAVRLRVSARARRVALRIDTARREVIATAPSPRRLAEAAAFAEQRRGWIVARLAELPAPTRLAPGAVIDVMGRPCALTQGAGRARWRRGPTGEPLEIVAPGEGEAFARAVFRLLKAEAREALVARTEVHARALGQPTPAVSVADARGRWGSCRPAPRRGFGAALSVGRIRYSWRLVLAPAAVLDYVAAHECAHLIEANHSPKFWAVVRDLIGDERPHRAWLRAHGTRLHGFGG
jgi:predicted metal-dependent hydrolase